MTRGGELLAPYVAGLLAATLGVPACLDPGSCGEVNAVSGVCLDPGAVQQTHFGGAPNRLRPCDLDGDGALDLVAASHEGGSVTVVWGIPGRLGTHATTS